MNYSEIKMLVLLEILAPEDGIDRYGITDSLREEMMNMIRNKRSMTDVLRLLPESENKNKMLSLAEVIDNEVEKEDNQTEQEEV